MPVLGRPRGAETLARAGLGKTDVKRELHRRARLPARQIERYVGEWTNIVPGFPWLHDLARRGELPGRRSASGCREADASRSSSSIQLRIVLGLAAAPSSAVPFAAPSGYWTTCWGLGSWGKLRMSEVLHWWSATTKCQSRGSSARARVSTWSW